MGFQPKIAIIKSTSAGITVYDNTGTYDPTTNPTGYGSPNPAKNTITAILLTQAALGKPLPTASALSSTDRSYYLDGTGVLVGTNLMDGVYDVHALIGYAGLSQLTANLNTSQFTLSNASVVFAEAVGFTLSSDPTHLYRIDRTRPLNTTGGYVTEVLPTVTNDDIIVYYEAQKYALVYDQGDVCLQRAIANSNIGCECNDDEVDELMKRYASQLSMLAKFNATPQDVAGADKIAKHLQALCPCPNEDINAGTGSSVPTSSTGVPPVITMNPADQAINNGGTVVFTVAATGSPTLGYQWRKNGVDIPGQTGNTLTLLNVQNSDAGQYSVFVYNTYGSALSTAATLTVTNAIIPVTIIQQPVSQTVAMASDVTFTVVATGTAPITYQWRKDGVPIVGETNSSLTLIGVDGTDEANYDVVVTNDAGSVTSTVATLTLGVGALWGWKSAIPGTVGDLATLQGSGAFTPGGTITADFRANSTPMYLIMAEPATEPIKTKWFAASDNQGNIGNPATDLFGAPLTIGSYRVYVTVYKTFNTINLFEFRVS